MKKISSILRTFSSGLSYRIFSAIEVGVAIIKKISHAVSSVAFAFTYSTFNAIETAIVFVEDKKHIRITSKI